jgi:hypothetical protein
MEPQKKKKKRKKYDDQCAAEFHGYPENDEVIATI